jgi:tetratricopeptide (TPR) repeat protein
LEKIMAEDESLNQAIEYFQDAYRHQMKGDYDEAVELYRKSIETYPTAEAYTFLGWTYSFMGDFDAAIDECHRAIEVDPEFGNPYNDIGAYLIEKGQIEEAIPWLEKAILAARYDNPAFPYFNLGRIWEFKHEYARAISSYRHAVELDPKYTLAKTGIRRIQGMLN